MSGDDVRRIYERHPYPRERSEWRTPKWRLPPVEWINAVWPRDRAPDRILVAGCGTGSEAFALRRKFPRADIVAVDFSPRSIAIARDSQRQLRGRSALSFRVADLASSRFPHSIGGGGFDFVTCHGVLSYIRRPERVLTNLAHVLAPDGALYLGVNGAHHFSESIRAALPSLGMDAAELTDLAAARQLLELCDTIRGRGEIRVARLPQNRLAGDLFGPRILNLPLARWVAMANDAGLHFRNSLLEYWHLRRLLADDRLHLLWPKSHAEAIQIVDVLAPAAFHKLLFSRKATPPPPWNRRNDLGRWKPSFTSLFRASLPQPNPRRSLQKVSLKGPAVETQIDLQLTPSEIAALHRCDGTTTVRDILAGAPPAESDNLTRRLLYGLYQVLVLRLEQG